jgi:hypothetical protein
MTVLPVAHTRFISGRFTTPFLRSMWSMKKTIYARMALQIKRLSLIEGAFCKLLFSLSNSAVLVHQKVQDDANLSTLLLFPNSFNRKTPNWYQEIYQQVLPASTLESCDKFTPNEKMLVLGPYLTPTPSTCLHSLQDGGSLREPVRRQNDGDVLVVHFAIDPTADMFQFGRVGLGANCPNDFQILGPIYSSSTGAQCGPVSRFACRVRCERTPPYNCYLYAGGFDGEGILHIPQELSTATALTAHGQSFSEKTPSI